MTKPPEPLEDRRALAGACAAVDTLARLGVTARLTGSLARGDFGPHSDVDLLVTQCPREHRCAIESVVEDLLGELPFHVIYLDEVAPWRRPALLASASELA